MDDWDGPIARVVVTEVQGSAPREVGASMLVWASGQSGTIGGGALEYQACAEARDLLANGGVKRVARVALGANLGQCCGGAVGLLTEVYDKVPAGVLARPMGDGAEMPLAVARLLANARHAMIAPQMVQGWFVEQIAPPARQVWIWGAGHVGRAIVTVLSPLVAITWVDTGLDRFPDVIPDGVRVLPVVDPVAAVKLAPKDSEHLILTFSHVLDLALCDVLLRHGFGDCGLIGSATKWARFRARLAALGHAPAEIARIACPIGDPDLGKHPQAIAIGVAAAMMKPADQARSVADVR
jgi:xanthine dehydrogenase accessory factor